jgi:hypothetical protein
MRIFAAMLLTVLALPAARADDKCVIIGTFTVAAVKAGATNACVITKHPLACLVAEGLKSTAAQGVATKGATELCKWAVEINDKMMMTVTIKADTKQGVEEAQQAEKELQKAKEYKPNK